jgi:hypothetical protein
MQRSRIIGTASLAALFLAACGHDHDWNNNNCCFSPIPPNYGPVSLLSLSDAERELGNIATTMSLVDISSGTPGAFAAAATPAVRSLGPSHAAVRAFSGSQAKADASPHAAVSTCASGGSDQVSSGSKTRTFNFFNFSGTVNYTIDNYNGCANTDSSGTKTTYDGLLETGLDTSSVYSYAVLGQPSINNTVTIFTDGNDANGTPLHTEEDQLGTIEQQNSNSTLDNRSNLFDTLFASQPNQPDYDGSFQIGSNANGSGVYEVISSSSSLNVAGQYAYASTACYGGAVTVTTPTTLTLGTSSAGSGLPVGGALGISSGSNSVTYTFNSDGSATLSGSVTGTISASQVQSILQSGTIC